MITIANNTIQKILLKISGYKEVLDKAASLKVEKFYEENRKITYKVLFFEWSRKISDKKILQHNYLYINYLTNQYYHDSNKLEKLEYALNIALLAGSDITLDSDYIDCLGRYEITKKGLDIL